VEVFIVRNKEERMIKITSDYLVKHPKEYSEKNFWNKIKKVATNVGGKVIYATLLLYYTMQKPSVPPWAKTVIVGALGYFILPFDAIPDLVPVGGYVDDLGALAIALSSVAIHIDKDVKIKARQKIQDIFGNRINMDELFEVEKNFEDKKDEDDED